MTIASTPVPTIAAKANTETQKKESFFDRLIKTRTWKALEESGRKRAEFIIKNGYYYI